MSKWRQRGTVVVEAMQWDGGKNGPNGSEAIEEWTGEKVMYGSGWLRGQPRHCMVVVDGDDTVIDKSDWIVKLPDGRLVPMKPLQFNALYEREHAAAKLTVLP